MRAATLARTGDQAAVRRQATRRVKALPDSPAAYYVASRIDAAFGSPALARAMLSAGVRLNPHSAVSYTMRSPIAHRWRSQAGAPISKPR